MGTGPRIARLIALIRAALRPPPRWWRAEGVAFWTMTAAYAASWLILLKATLTPGPRCNRAPLAGCR
jgi:hypothetical protein